MDYDEKEFQARANRIARGMWIAMVTVLSLVYGCKRADITDILFDSVGIGLDTSYNRNCYTEDKRRKLEAV